MSDPDRVFLTEQRREVLNGEYDGTESTRRSHISNTQQRARVALQELIAVAGSPVINNADVFDPDEVYALLTTLVSGRGGVMDWDEGRPLAEELGQDEAKIHAWRADPDYQREVFERLDRARLDYHDAQRENGRGGNNE